MFDASGCGMAAHEPRHESRAPRQLALIGSEPGFELELEEGRQVGLEGGRQAIAELGSVSSSAMSSSTSTA